MTGVQTCALPICPDSGAADLGSISDFVKSVADHLGDRATQLEQTRYQSHLAHARPRYPSVYTSIPERQGATGPREVPWDRTVVLLPADDTVVEWTKEHQHTICPVSGLPARLAAGATHVLLYDGAGASKYMCRLDRAGPEIVSRSDLDELGCPGLIGGTHDSYFRWKIEDDLYYTRLSFDLSRSADLKALVDALRPGVISIWDLEQTLLRE